MSENGVSYSFEVNPAAAPGATAAAAGDAGPLTAFAACSVVSINSALSLVINTLSGRQRLIANDVLNALTTCTQYDSLAAHTARICRLRPDLAQRQAQIESTLRQLWRGGILVDSEQQSARLGAGSSEPGRGTDKELQQDRSQAERAPTRIVMLTADRPETLARLLESLLQSSGLSAHSELLLIDDSRDPALAGENRSRVEEFNLRSAKSVFYVGPELQASLLSRLHDALPQHGDSIDYLLARQRWGDAPTYGRARTLGLLLTVGYRAIFLDDDILCQALPPPDLREALRFGHAGERKAVFYPDREVMLGSAGRLAESPLALHADLLGRSIGEVSGSAARLDLQHCEAAMALQFDAGSRVIVTQCGSWGDPGTADPHWALRLQRDSLELLASSGSALGTMLEARACWFGCSGPTIMKNAFMSQMTGLDNAQMLPPYFPAYRAEDQLFGSMLNAMHPHSAVFEFGWGVPHLPPEERGAGALRRPIPPVPGLGLAARLVDSLVDYSATLTPQQNLERIAAQLDQVASYSLPDLEAQFRTLFAVAQGEQFRHLQQLKEATGELPAPNWQAYLDRALEEVQGALQTAADFTTLGGGLAREEVHARVSESSRGFAAALRAWPAMREQADLLWATVQEHARS